MTFTTRQISVQLQLIGDTFDAGGDSLQLDGLRVACTVQGTQGGATPYQSLMTLRVFGMLSTDMAKLSTLGLTVGTYQKTNIAVYAGDVLNGMSLIFNGQVFAAYVDYNAMPDVGVIISASQTAQLQQAPIAASSFQGSLNVATMLQGIAAAASPPLAFVNAGVSAVLANHAVAGDAHAQIADICQAAGVLYDISQGTLTIWPPGGSRDATVISLSAATGMIGYPQYSAQGLDVACEFNPNVLLGRQVTIDSSIPKPGPNAPIAPSGNTLPGASGTYWVTDVVHDLSAQVINGPWLTRMKLSTINSQARVA